MRRNTRAYEVSMIVYAAADADISSVKDVLNDLTWVGGCRDPENDPGFDGLLPSKVQVKRRRDLDREGKPE